MDKITTVTNNLLSSSLHLLISKSPSTRLSSAFKYSPSSLSSSSSSSSSSAFAAVSTLSSSVRTARSVPYVTDIKIDKNSLTKAINIATYLKDLLKNEFSNLVNDVTISEVEATATDRPKIPTEIIQDAESCTNILTILERLRFFLLAYQPWIGVLPQYHAGTTDMAVIVSKFENLGETIMDMLPTDVIKLAAPNTRSIPAQDLSVVLDTLAGFYTETIILIQIFTDLKKCYNE